MSWKAYLEYKQSGVEWLGDVPEHWIYGRLGDYVKLINGFPFDSQNFDREVGTPLIRIRDILNNFTEVNWAGKDITEAAVRAGDILIGMDGDFNVAWWSGPRAMLNQRVCCLRAKDILNQRYLFYLVGYPLRVINDVTYATTVKHLSSFDVLKIRLLLPKYSEQTAIATFLDRETARIDTLIEKKQRQIELLQEKRSALINHAVTKGLDPNVKMKDSGIEWLGDVPEHWKVAPIRSFARSGYKTFTDGDWIESPYIRNEGIRLIQTGNIGIGSYKEQGFRYIDDNTFRELRCTEVLPGDVLICRLADPVGRACLAPDLGTQMITSVDVCILKPADDIDPGFVVYAMSGENYLAWMSATCRGGTRDRVSRSMLGSVRIIVPPLDEQHAIASFLDRETARIDALFDKVQCSIERLHEYRTALISAAVTGKIDVRDEAQA